MFVKPVTYTVSKFFASTRPAGRPCGARVVRGEKKKRGGSGPPAKPVKAAKPPSQNSGGLGGSAPQPKPKKF